MRRSGESHHFCPIVASCSILSTNMTRKSRELRIPLGAASSTKLESKGCRLPEECQDTRRIHPVESTKSH